MGSRCGRSAAALPPGALCLGAALSGVCSFCLLAAAIGTDYWYLVRVDPAPASNLTTSAWDAEQLSSHAGLWRLCEGWNACMPLIDPFGTQSRQVPASLQHLISLLTLSGTSIYICYSRAAYTETVRMFDPQHFKHVHIAFGWSLALAWLSFGTEVLAGWLLLLAAWGLSLKPEGDSVVI
ncbi:transmembrane protein 235 isoform X2 [Hemicordylus capensis]|uniref:transmembrane protein 235 isoform X2 n=1 Tax=Hemicordylus capensis TaxID=884348 RepID=UPI002302E4D2|nr:transmembrane protein 235 isoform X2 [Hemicordylus capensis]